MDHSRSHATGFTGPLRILVADDHEIVRRGLRGLLEAEPGWSVVEAPNGREAVEQACSGAIDLAVLDITMPETNGLDACREIRRLAPDVEVLFLSMHQSETVIRDVLDAGASGYVLKSDAGEDLVAAVRSLQQGTPFFSSRATRLMMNGYRSAGPPGPRTPLTTRERQVMALLAEARSNKEVAALLGISIKTTEAHRANLMRKLGVHSISEFMRYALTGGVKEG